MSTEHEPINVTFEELWADVARRNPLLASETLNRLSNDKLAAEVERLRALVVLVEPTPELTEGES